jgi:peptide/nickel transport system substrate-binding protein
LTADDVKATFDSIRDPAFKSPKGGSFAQIREITVVDPDTIRFDLAEPFAPFLLNLTTGIVPRASVERLGAEFAERPIGTGPFRFQRWEPDARLELVSHRDYFEGPPKLDRLVYKIVPDPTVRVLELEKGTIDLLQNDIPPDLLPRLQGNPRLTVLKEAGTNYAYLGFNLRDPILQQRQIRQAIAYAIHRREIISHVLKGLATPAAGILPPTHWAYAPDLPSYDYDPERARRLLDAAGYPAPEGGALIERGRSTLEPDARTAAYHAIQRIMAADLPYVSLWFSTNVAAMRADLEGFELYPAGDLTSLRRVYRKGQPYTHTRDGAAWRERSVNGYEHERIRRCPSICSGASSPLHWSCGGSLPWCFSSSTSPRAIPWISSSARPPNPWPG